MKRFGGWHRIWIVLSGLWVIPVLISYVDDYPEGRGIEERYFRQCLGIGVMTAYKNAQASADHKRLEVIRKAIKSVPGSRRSLLDDYDPRGYFSRNFTDEQILDSLKHSTDFQGADYTPAELERNASIEVLQSKRTKWAFHHILFWLLPVVFVYLLGKSIGWIVQGFKKAAP